MGWFDWLYGPEPKKEPVWKRDEKLTNKPDKDVTEDDPPRSVAPDKELKGLIHVKKINLMIDDNKKAHRTDKYECTEDRTTWDGKEDTADLVLRRGQSFRICVTFDRSYSIKKDDIRIIMKTGRFAELNSVTYGQMEVDESGKTKFTPDKWAAKLVPKSIKGNDATFEINIRADAAIGEWSLSVETITVQDKKKKHYRYEHPDNMYILFNPWCRDDQTYMPDCSLLDEYVLNDHGAVYRGNQYSPKPKAWNYGQFEDGILEASLFIIRKCFRGKKQYKMCDPVMVARVISQVVNCCDSDNGVLWGNWSGNYSDGVSPSEWAGSVKILLQYYKTGKPVKYGQCWVFSAVTTTVCRAIGLPARSVTNFASAHDTDNSCTIDKYYCQNEDGNLVLDNNSDSVWNFHVWNDIWCKRPDIPCSKNEFDGWQAIDATPQEKSDGLFMCGPCPVYAIKHGLVNKPFDCAFIFSEVNSDEVHWKPASCGGYVKFKVKHNKIGKALSTKKPDGKRFDGGSWFTSRYREDVTNDYKFKDGSEDSRRSVLRAALGAANPKDAYSKCGEETDVVFKFLHEADLSLGQDIEVKLSAKNTNKTYARKVKAVTFNFQKQKYTGEIVSLIQSVKLDEEKELKPGQQHEFQCVLKHNEYLGKLEEEKCMCLQAYAMVEKTRRCPMESCVKSHDIELGDPELKVKLPEKVKKGEEFEAEVTLNNPLSEELQNCMIGYESGGFPHKDNIKQDNVPKMGTFTGKFTLKAKRCGEFTVTFKFDSKQLRFVTGSAGIVVEK